MANPLVTIVIPTFNDAPEHLEQAVESAQAQDYPQVEVIVIDDGSSAPVDIGNARLLRQPNRGVAAARNRGIALAGGELVVCLDADDRLSPTYVSESVAALELNACATLAYPRVQEFGEGTNVWWPGAGRDLSLLEFAVHSPVAVSSPFRRADWEAVGGFDESLRIGHEDYEFWVRLLGKCGGVAAAMPTATLYYRIRANSRARTHWAEARANTRAAIREAANRETLKTLLQGSDEYVQRLEKELARLRADRFNIRNWPRLGRRAARRTARVIRG